MLWKIVLRGCFQKKLYQINVISYVNKLACFVKEQKLYAHLFTFFVLVHFILNLQAGTLNSAMLFSDKNMFLKTKIKDDEFNNFLLIMKMLAWKY